MVLPDSDTSLSLYRTQDNSFNPNATALVWAQVCSLYAMILRSFTNVLLNFFFSFAVWRY